ncbi:MAG: hypothetical protein ACLVC5_07715 [Clostridia bacterium]
MSVEFRKKFKRKKILSFASAAVVAFTMTAAPVFAATDSGNTKDETVYVVTESDGSQSDLIVSDHLKNKSGKDKIEDVSTLTDIENVKGKEKFTREDDGSLSWNAKGNDIYYEGKTDQEAPVSMDIKYYLDDKEVDGADLSGKTGKVKIVINYTNNTSLNGTKVPFVVLTGMVLENDTFQNVTVSSGKVIDDGQKSFIVGMAAPGVADTLGISEEELGFGSTVEITGDAKEFAPEDMMTVVTNDFFQDIDTSELNAGNLDSQIDQLDSAAKQLVAGTNTLYKGIETLNSNSATLAAGVSKLNQGAAKIDENTKAALQGSKDLAAGSQFLSSQLNSKLTDMGEGVNTLASKSEKLADGLKDMQSKVNGNNTKENPGLAPSAKGFAQKVAGLDTVKTEISRSVASDKEAIAELRNLETSMDDETKASVEEQLTTLETNVKTKENYLNGFDTATLTASANAISAGVDAIQAGLNGDGTTENPGAVNGANALTQAIKTQLGGAIQDATASDSELSIGLNKLITGSSELAAGEAQLSDGASELAAGMNELYSKSGLLISGIGQLDAGSKKLNDGMSQFYKEGIGKIVSLYNDKLKGTVNNAESLVAAGKAYNTFTQVPDGMDGTVKFIYRTKVAD